MDFYGGDVEDIYNFEKPKTQKACKILLQEKSNCHKNKKKLFLPTKIMMLIFSHMKLILRHMKIKPTVRVKHVSIFCI